MLRYAISDRTLFSGDESTRQARLIRQAVILAQEGVEYFQLREKDLAAESLLALTLRLREAVAQSGRGMQVLLNGPWQIAQRAGVGWHGNAQSAEEASWPTSVSVHTPLEVEARRDHAALLLFAPVFEKTVAGTTVQPGVGLQRLHEAVQRAGATPVLALGGITLQNAAACMDAGAAGIAGIRLFHR